MRVDGKIAIVTGAGQGIGKAIALELARRGADVACLDMNKQGAQSTAAAVDACGRKAIAVCADVAVYDQVVMAVEDALQSFGRIDILVNNAGWDIIQPFTDTTPEFWDKVIGINLKGVINCAHACLRKSMIEHHGGKIVNIASDAGRVGSMGETVYAAAKGGVIAFTKSLAREVARYSINVNCVCPGPTDTDLYRNQSEKVREALERAIPFRRVAQPYEIAYAAVFFASPLSDYVTGQVLSVSGGLTMVG